MINACFALCTDSGDALDINSTVWYDTILPNGVFFLD